MNEEKERIRQELLKELEQLTKYYKEVSARGKQIKKFYDNEINRIVKALKELGVYPQSPLKNEGFSKNKTMLSRVLELKERFINAATQEEKNAIDEAMQELIKENPNAWAEAMVESAKRTADKAESLVKRERIRAELGDSLNILPLSHIAEHYFKKSRQWLYQRINGNIVNGKPVQFTDEEIETLNFALQDISKKIGSIRVA